MRLKHDASGQDLVTRHLHICAFVAQGLQWPVRIGVVPIVNFLDAWEFNDDGDGVIIDAIQRPRYKAALLRTCSS